MIDLWEVTVRVRHGGTGPPLLLLHGHPQTHVMWHAVAPGLAKDFTVIAPDLRGYGESSKPETTPGHMPYSKRVRAQDQIALMQHFGFEQFSVAGHDRGGRCSYRLALDHPEALADYLGACHNPETIHAMCEDYRAAATIDYQLDGADRGVKRIPCPVLVLWSKDGEITQWYDVLSVWRDWADDVRGEAIEGNHYFAEQTPEATYRALHKFFVE